MSDNSHFEILLIEDDHIQSDYLQNCIKNNFPNVKLQRAYSLMEVQQILQNAHPPLIIADVVLGSQNIFMGLNDLDTTRQQIIFLTAYEEFRVQAFEWYGLDFILKPVDEARLIKSIQLAMQRYQAGVYTSPDIRFLQEELAGKHITHIALPLSNSHRIVLIDDIIAIEAERSYCKVHLQDNSVQLLSKSLSWMEDKLKEIGFVRTHRSWLVNPRHIIEFIRGNHVELKLSTGLLVAVTESMRNRVWEILRRFTILD
ncbi:MAG: DNA-binding response regulator [Sphingobacteriia bacterium]|nr:DNA-binding response regulator [Sphingobacteriia bacterium]